MVQFSLWYSFHCGTVWGKVGASFVMYGTDLCVAQCIFVKTNIGALSTDTVDHGVLQW